MSEHLRTDDPTSCVESGPSGLEDSASTARTEFDTNAVPSIREVLPLSVAETVDETPASYLTNDAETSDHADTCETTSDVEYEPSGSEESTSTYRTEIDTTDELFSEDFLPISASEYSDDSTPFSPVATAWDDCTDDVEPSCTVTPGELLLSSSDSPPHDDPARCTTTPTESAAQSQSRRKRYDSGIGGSDGSPCKPTTEKDSRTVTTKRQRNTVYCFFCEEPVLQFARHLERHHESELEVQRLTALRKNSLERKQLLGIIRNKGNYLQSKANNVFRPVRKPAVKRDSSLPLPCNGCYGLFAKKQLWRHVRRCPAKKSNRHGTLPHSQNLAQNMMLAQVEGDDFLKGRVFPRMRADLITETVKTDPLICAYGGRFAKTHQEKHQVNFISRKMRELGKLLIALKKADPQITSLMDALNPGRYKLLVQCAKEVARFDRANNRFSSPTYAMNIQTSLKDCCQIACNFLYQHAHYPDRRSYEEAEFPFQRLIATISSEWKYDVSHQAASNLQTSSMNKITIVPLASDLYRFRQYLVGLANESVAALQYDDRNLQAYKNLVESAYCRVMLLCRKRCGELSRLTVEVYLESGDRHSYEEFADAIRPSEMVLVRKFKRVVIQGKRKCTPVIFSDDVQNHVETILKLRSHFVPLANPYLFGNAKTDNPISGYKVIQKHALKASLAHPEAMTTRCLRKHLATVCQVLAMSDQDIEQLATFMGHTGQIHRSEYRLPDDLFQTAKVSKLLLMMEAGQAGQFKGKTLDEIEIDLETDLLQEITLEDVNVEDDEELAGNHNNAGELHNLCPPQAASTSSHIPAATTSRPPNAKVKKFSRHLWSDEEKRLALDFFSEHVRQKKAPKKDECETLMSQHPEVFGNRPWQKMKVFIHNTYSKKT